MPNMAAEMLIGASGHPAAAAARTRTQPLQLLERTAALLGLPALPRGIGEALREALPWPWDDTRYESNALVPGRPPLELSFSESDPATLRFDFEPCRPGTLPACRRERASQVVRQWVRECFAAAEARDFERSLDVLCSQPLGPRPVFGAFLAAVCDGRGLAAAKIYCELNGGIPEGYPSGLVRAATAALDGIKGLTPHLASLACGRERCVPRLYFLCREEVPLVGLRPALAAAGLEHRLPELISLVTVLPGIGLMLPAGAAVLSFREDAGTIDCKLEFFTRALPQSPESLARNLQFLLAERPATRAALHRWVRALGEDGPTPERVNAVGFRASSKGPSQFGLYVSPSKWSAPCPT